MIEMKRTVCLMQGLQSKLCECESLQDSLKCLSQQLTSVSDTSTALEFVTEVDKMTSRHGNLSSDVDAGIRQLEQIVASWADVTADVESCSQSLGDAQQMLADTTAPQSQGDIQLQSDRLKVGYHYNYS